MRAVVPADRCYGQNRDGGGYEKLAAAPDRKMVGS